MGRGYGPFVALYAAISVCGFAWRMKSFIASAPPHDAMATELARADRMLRSLFQSSLTTAFMANVLVSIFTLMAFCTKALFFGQISPVETQNLLERLINHVIFKGLFLALIVQPDMVQIALWLVWFSVLVFLKMFQGLAKDRLERLNASPAAALFSHVRVFTVLMLVLLSDLFWIQLCFFIFKDRGINTLLLLLFEPLSIAFDTLQAVVVHGMHLLDIWNQRANDMASQCLERPPSERSAAGAAWEWRGMMVHNCSFFMDIVSLLLALGHCLHIWWLQGLAFQFVDGILFLNMRALLSAILKRIKGFMKVRTAMNTLQGALPDATEQELLGYEDDCAICKEPMGRAKRLPCAHLFHLPCLRSWLDQGIAETYSCPTCRRPLFMGSGKTGTPGAHAGHHQSSNGDQARRRGMGMEHLGGDGPEPFHTNLAHRGIDRLANSFSNHQWDASMNTAWRVSEAASGWSNPLLMVPSDNQEVRSSAPRGVVRMQTVLEHLTRSHQSMSEASWSWWPFGSRIREGNLVQMGATRERRSDATAFYNQSYMPSEIRIVRDPHMQAMVNMVREVLPDIPEFMVIQDLQRTNSVTTTVNNLL